MPLDRPQQVEGEVGVARTRDGVPIAFSLYRHPRAAARFALVHSLAMDRHFWDPVAERLARHASVLIYDCRGHGASGKPPGPYTAEGFAQDLAGLITAVGWDSAAVAGASMGGCVALAFAAAHPARTRALGLVDTTAWYGPDAPAQWNERAAKAGAAGLGALVEFQTTRWFTDAFRAASPETVRSCVETFLGNDVAAYAATCRMLGAVDLRDTMRKVQAPTAIVVGREDYATPVAMAEALRAGIAGATLTVIEDGRHLTPLEHPDRIAAEFLRLVERCR